MHGCEDPFALFVADFLAAVAVAAGAVVRRRCAASGPDWRWRPRASPKRKRDSGTRVGVADAATNGSDESLLKSALLRLMGTTSGSGRSSESRVGRSGDCDCTYLSFYDRLPSARTSGFLALSLYPLPRDGRRSLQAVHLGGQ